MTDTERWWRASGAEGLRPGELAHGEQADRDRVTVVLPSPADDVALRIGRIVYAVAYLEWTVLGDLHHVVARGAELPDEIAPDALRRHPAGRMARTLRQHAPAITNTRLRVFLTAASETLQEVADLRNRVLHAHPYTDADGEASLRRREPDGAATDLSVALLDETLSAITNCVLRLQPLRVILDD